MGADPALAASPAGIGKALVSQAEHCGGKEIEGAEVRCSRLKFDSKALLRG